jgi:hypothetical protein
MFGEREVRDIIQLLRKSFAAIIAYRGEIPGATEK